MKKKEKGVYAFNKEALAEIVGKGALPSCDTAGQAQRGAAGSRGRQRALEKKKLLERKNKTPSLWWMGDTLTIEGFNQTRLLNELRENGVGVYGVVRTNPSNMQISIVKKDLVKAFAILERMCYTYKVVKSSSPKTIGLYLLNKLGLALAVAIFVALGVYAYGFVWRLELSGYEKIEPLLVKRHLAENGFGVGVRKSRFELSEIRALINDLEDVLEATVELRGTTLRVSIIETTDYALPPTPNMNGIFSRFDAEVTRVIAESGTPNVVVGQRVFSGASLIGAYRVSVTEEVIPTPSIGRVYGNVTFTDSSTFSLTENVRQRTGNRDTRTALSVWGLNIGARARHQFALSEAVTTTTYAFNNFFLPIRMAQTVYYELQDVEITHTLEQRLANFKDESIANRAMLMGSSPYTLTYHIEELGGAVYRVHTFITVELLIGET